MDFLRERHAQDATRLVSDVGYLVNWAAYESYLTKHYPNLERPNLHELEHIERDKKLHNPIDIAQYNGFNSPDDIWDKMARSLYGMGYLGYYSRIASCLENGRNYVCDFQEFAQIYPCLRSMHGDASKLKNMLSKDNDVEISTEDRSNKRLIEYYTYFYKNGRKFEKVDPRIYNSVKDVELERRSPFNQSLIYADENDNPKGTVWTYLTVDKEKVEYDNIFRWQYGLSPASPNVHDNKRYIYEKYVFCTASSCSAVMRVIIDCIHNVVIVSMINSHFECLETHKRRVFDVVRKLVVLHNADLTYIDEKYLSIPRRYGLTYVESWVNSDEFDRFKLSDYTPSYYCYYYDRPTSESDTWSLGKSRTWLTDIYYDKKQQQSVTKKRSLEKQYTVDPRVQNELIKIGIRSWKADAFRKNRAGRYIVRGEWEFHLDQDTSDKLKEIYRIWRTKYFETSDKLRTNIKLCEGSMIKLAQFYFVSVGNIKNVQFSTPITPKILAKTTEKLAKMYVQFKNGIINSFLKQYSWPIIDPAFLIPSYPLNRRLDHLSNVPDDSILDDGNYIIINSTIEELANCDQMYISQRYVSFDFANFKNCGIADSTTITKSPYDLEFEFSELYNKLSARDKYLEKNRIFNDYLSPSTTWNGHDTWERHDSESPFKWGYMCRLLGENRRRTVIVPDLSSKKSYYKLSQVKAVYCGKAKDAFVIHPKLLHETTFIDDMVANRSVVPAGDLTILEFPTYGQVESSRYADIFSGKNNLENLQAKVSNFGKKFKIEVFMADQKVLLPVEALNNALSMIMAKSNDVDIIEKFNRMLDKYQPPLRYIESHPFTLLIDGIVYANGTGFARSLIKKMKTIGSNIVSLNSNSQKDTNIIDYGLGSFIVFRGDTVVGNEDIHRYMKFSGMFEKDAENKKFKDLFRQLCSGVNDRSRDMVDAVLRIKGAFENVG